MGVGVSELAVMIPFALVTIAVPIAVIVLQIMIYRKVSRIEQRLNGQRS